MPIHHPIAQSRGGDDSYTIDLSEYDHAYTHAVDFVLFDHAPRFDFRMPAWPCLPADLKEAVLEKACQLGVKFGQRYGSAAGRIGGTRNTKQQRQSRSQNGKLMAKAGAKSRKIPIVAIAPNGEKFHFASCQEAAEGLGLKKSGVSRVLAGKANHHHGFIFQRGLL